MDNVLILIAPIDVDGSHNFKKNKKIFLIDC